MGKEPNNQSATSQAPVLRYAFLRKDVSAKIYYGTFDEDVLNWLTEKYELDADFAQKLIALAHEDRRTSIRKQALLKLLESNLGMVLIAALVYLLVNGVLLIISFWPLMGYFFVPIALRSIRIIILAVCSYSSVCVGTFVSSLYKLITGKTVGPVN